MLDEKRAPTYYNKTKENIGTEATKMQKYQEKKRTGMILLKTLYSFFLCLMVCFAPQVMGAGAKNGIVQGKELFLQGRDAFYRSQTPLAEVMAILTAAKQSLHQTKNHEGYYWLGQVEYLLGEVAEVAGNKREAARGFTESENRAKQALDLNKKSSDAHRLLADTYMRLMSYKGTLYMISHGPQALKLLKKALSLDPNNYTALNSLGMYYINSPKLGGGSVNKGIEVLEEALMSKDEFDNFISHIWLGQAWQKKNKKTEAIRHFKEALLIYPHNSWAKSLLEGCE